MEVAAEEKKMEEQLQLVAQKEAPIYGDVLELILSHVPLTDLVLASHVSKSWNRAVSSSLRHFNAPKPWLLVHTQTSRPPYATTSHAYDPRSNAWIQINRPSINYVSALRSFHSDLLYMLSPWKFSFSFDPLHLTWHHAAAPLVWRTDPIVAVVGHRVVVAGGTCGFEDELLAVEIYDIQSRTWRTCESMPSVLKDSAASTWISVAVYDRKLFVCENHSGVTYTFDPETSTWLGPYDLRPDPRLFYSVIGFADERLIIVGLMGDSENVEGVKLWGVNSESFECEEIGEMPLLLIEKLKSEVFQISSIGVCMAGNFVYIHNPMQVGELFVCEVVNGGCEWGSVRNVVVDDRNRMGRFVFTCSKVGMDDLNRAMRSENRRFLVKY